MPEVVLVNRWQIVQLDADNELHKMWIVKNDEKPMGYLIGLVEAIAYVSKVALYDDVIVINVQYPFKG